MLCSLLPLVIERMLGKLTIEGGFSLLGGVGIVLSVAP